MNDGVLGWRRGEGVALGDWLRRTVRRFEVGPGEFRVQRAGPERFVGGAGNGNPVERDIESAYADSAEAVVSWLLDNDVSAVDWVLRAPGSWSLRGTADGRSDIAWMKVFMPSGAAWPLPARPRDTHEAHHLLTVLAALLDLEPPRPAPAAPERFPQPVVVEGVLDASRYRVTVAGVGERRLYLLGETPQVVERLAAVLLAPEEATVLPLRVLGDLVHLGEALAIDRGYVPGSDRPAAPSPDVPLPAGARVTVYQTVGRAPAFRVEAGGLRADADHPALSLYERIGLLLCPQLYLPGTPPELAWWLPRLEKGVFGRAGIWTVSGGCDWRPPRHRGVAMVVRALGEQHVGGRAFVAHASAGTLTVRGLTLGGEPVELTGRTRARGGADSPDR
ncbi:hypothetical protein [Streptomyces sp. NBC_01716]|uniref:hypothetical protein n=1 Tax=Streptomyces sp. NBC_01716 TaxID=2975917 RepID=UPI002E374E73|nr:hypothetical protein [Streptomyces sp. NBC_01716]